MVLEAAEGARQLVRQLLAFGRKQALEVRPLDLSEQVRRIEKILRAMIPESIELVLELARGACGDPGGRHATATSRAQPGWSTLRTR